MRAAALEGEGDPVEELGDLLFVAVCVARFLDADPEDTLHAACDKFSARFRRLEALAAQRNFKLDELSDEEQLMLWRMTH